MNTDRVALASESLGPNGVAYSELTMTLFAVKPGFGVAGSGRRGKSRGGSLLATCSNQAQSCFQPGWFHQASPGDPGPLLLVVRVVTGVPSSPGHQEESEDTHTAHSGRCLLVGLPAKDCSCYSHDDDVLTLGYSGKPDSQS